MITLLYMRLFTTYGAGECLWVTWFASSAAFPTGSDALYASYKNDRALRNFLTCFEPIETSRRLYLAYETPQELSDFEQLPI